MNRRAVVERGGILGASANAVEHRITADYRNPLAGLTLDQIAGHLTDQQLIDLPKAVEKQLQHRQAVQRAFAQQRINSLTRDREQLTQQLERLNRDLEIVRKTFLEEPSK
jgi:hypothetical protein